MRLAAYRFDRYRTKEKPDKKPTIETVEIVAGDPAAAAAAVAPLAALADAVIFARDLVSEPANILYPEEFARRVKALEPLGLQRRDPRRGRDGQAGHGLAARRRPGQRAAKASWR